MKRLIPLLACTILIAIPLGVAVAGGAAPSAEPAAKRAPLALPASAPPALKSDNGGYSFRSEAWLAKSVGGGATADSSAATPSGPGATVTVTATVLPVRIIVVRASRVTSLVTNTPERASHKALYIVREGSANGPTRALTPGIWAQARELGTRAEAGTGTIATA